MDPPRAGKVRAPDVSAERQLEIMRRARACRGKVRHKSAGAAWAHVRAMRKAGICDGHAPYRCDFCWQWHIGRRTSR
jgi:hypothetical protein